MNDFFQYSKILNKLRTLGIKKEKEDNGNSYKTEKREEGSFFPFLFIYIFN